VFASNEVFKFLYGSLFYFTILDKFFDFQI